MGFQFVEQIGGCSRPIRVVVGVGEQKFAQRRVFNVGPGRFAAIVFVVQQSRTGRPAQAAADGYRVCAPVGDYLWIACGRAPGQAYRPALFATLTEAEAAAVRIAAVLWPGPDAQQEVYFNTQNFTR